MADLVRSTRHDGRPPPSPDAAHLIDLDLAVLGSPPAEFDRYERDVRAEYAHVPAADYTAGRTAVLRRLLDRPTIYTTPAGQRHEADARANLNRSVAALARTDGE